MSDIPIETHSLDLAELFARVCANTELNILSRPDISQATYIDALQTLTQLASDHGVLVVLDIIPPEVIRTAEKSEIDMVREAANTLAKLLETGLVESGILPEKPTLEGYGESFPAHRLKVALDVGELREVLLSETRAPTSTIPVYE